MVIDTMGPVGEMGGNPYGPFAPLVHAPNASVDTV